LRPPEAARPTITKQTNATATMAMVRMMCAIRR
jgi:hypothetical protein